MDHVDPVLLALGGGVISALLGAVGILWKENKVWQSRFLSERNKRIEDQKDHYQTSEIFLRALEKRRSGSSDPPPSSR